MHYIGMYFPVCDYKLTNTIDAHKLEQLCPSGRYNFRKVQISRHDI